MAACTDEETEKEVISLFRVRITMWQCGDSSLNGSEAELRLFSSVTQLRRDSYYNN